jgi:glycosyltransferase involved in cell wall biosynthesis
MKATLNFPLVSIGIPVYNSEKTLRNALESLLKQTYKNIEFIISDNNSTDSTASICREYQLIDQRIVFHKQSINIGPSENFDFVLKSSKGDFFMWAAGDDVRSLDFVEVNLRYLLNNPKCVAATSPNIHEDQEKIPENFINYSLDGTKLMRFQSFFKLPGASHGMFYSLIRTEVIKSCPYVSSKMFWAWDWSVILFLANFGSVHRNVQGYTIFGSEGVSRKGNIYKSLGIHGIHRLFPFMKFNRTVTDMTRNWPRRERFYVVYLLVGLNLKTLLKSNQISLVVFFNLKKFFSSAKSFLENRTFLIK